MVKKGSERSRRKSEAIAKNRKDIEKDLGTIGYRLKQRFLTFFWSVSQHRLLFLSNFPHEYLF